MKSQSSPQKTISREQVEALRQILRSGYGMDLSHQEAEEAAEWLVGFYLALFRLARTRRNRKFKGV